MIRDTVGVLEFTALATIAFAFVGLVLLVLLHGGSPAEPASHEDITRSAPIDSLDV